MSRAVGGSVYLWGSGELGVPVDKEKVAPYPTRLNLACKVLQVACADTSTIALTVDGKVLAWGSNPDGRLGHSAPNGVPSEVRGVENAIDIAAGQSHFLAVSRKKSGESVVVGWGSNFHSCLALDGSTSHVSSAVELPFFQNAIHVSAGYANSACITADGQLFVWGDNRFGKCLGGGDYENAAVIPVPIALPGFSSPIAFCALGSVYSAAIDDEGRLFTWGYGRAGNLGHGDRNDVPAPRLVQALLGIPVAHVACTVGQISPLTQGSLAGKENPHTLVVACDGRLFSFGTCHKGILGNHSKKILAPPDGDELLPYCVGSSPARDGDVKDCPTGYLANEHCTSAVSSSIHSCVVTASGKAFSFGCGSGGRMGIEQYMLGLHGGRSRMKCYVSVPTAIEYFQQYGLNVLKCSSSRRHMAAVVTAGNKTPPPPEAAHA